MFPFLPRRQRLHRSIAMSPSECVLQRRVRSEADRDLDYTNLPLFILECKDRKTDGYADDKLEIYNKRLDDMVIGVRLADAPPAVSYLVILHSDPYAKIVAADKTVIVIRLNFREEEDLSYLIYDAVALSLLMIPAPENFSRHYPLSSDISFVRPCRGPDYALLNMGRLDASGEGDFIKLWRPSSSPPWSEYKKVILPRCIDWAVNRTNKAFSFNGNAFWVDLLSGISYCSCDALFNDNCSVVKFGSYIPLPVPPGGHGIRNAVPATYRTIGVVRDSFIRFVSINGFQEYVPLEERTVTVWKRVGNKKWEEEYKFSLAKLWGFKGFGDLPKDLTPMYPLLSTEDTDVVYLVLGEYSDTGKEIYPSELCHLLAIDMRNEIVRTFEPQEYEEDWFATLISCSLSQYLLVGPCDDEGIPMKKKPRMKCRRCGGNVVEAPITMKKKTKQEKRRRNGGMKKIRQEKRRRNGGNVLEAPFTMKKKPRLEKSMCC